MVQSYRINPLPEQRQIKLAICAGLSCYLIAFGWLNYQSFIQQAYIDALAIVRFVALLATPLWFYLLKRLYLRQLPRCFNIDEAGNVLYQESQYLIDKQSVYLGQWVWLVVQRIDDRKNRRVIFFAPDALTQQARSRLKRVIKRHCY